MQGDVASHSWKISAMVEYTIIEKDEKEEDNTDSMEASKNGASLAPAIDLRSVYVMIIASAVFVFPRFGHAPSTVPSMSVSPTLRAAARSVYRDLLRASATTFAGTVGLLSNNIFSLLLTEGDPPVLLGMDRFLECRFHPLTPS